jgi:PAS domain S-box-containing protein
MMPGNKIPLRVILVEDSEFDAHLLVAMLRGGGYELVFRVVDNAASMKEALESGPWDLVLSDYSMPQFTLQEALEILRLSGVDVPFIIVSAGIGEDTALQAMKEGASDFIMKGNLKKLLPVIERELREASTRAARRYAESALRENELRYRLLCENSPDALLIIDVQGRIHYANPGVERAFGYSPEALAGQNLSLLQPESLRHKPLEIIEAVMRDRSSLGASDMRPTLGCTRDGREIPIEIAFRPVRFGKETRLAVFIRDGGTRQKLGPESRVHHFDAQAARDIKKSLLLPIPSRLAGIDLAVRPCPGDELEGSYFEFIPNSDGAGLIIATGNVSNPGPAGALLMAEALACLHVLAKQNLGISSILTQMNTALSRFTPPGDSIALLLAKVDLARHILTFASAGHGCAILIDKSGQSKLLLEPCGVPLGTSPDIQYDPPSETTVASSDLLLLLPREAAPCFSAQGEPAVTEFWRGLTSDARQRSAADLAQRVQDHLIDALRGRDQAQDLTVIVAKL